METQRGLKRILFHLERDVDESGISGAGIVAEGVVFSNGKAVLSWLTDYTSVAIYENIEHLEAIHGHAGKTRIVLDCVEYTDGKRSEVNPVRAGRPHGIILDTNDVSAPTVAEPQDPAGA